MNKDQVRAALAAALADTGVELKAAAADVALYAEQRAEHLAEIANEAGFAEAVIAERDAVASYAARGAVRTADAGDQRLLGLVHGFLLAAVGAAT